MYEIECFHRLGTPESERLKGTALNLFHLTASPPFQRVGFFILRHSPWGERVRVRGNGLMVTPTLVLVEGEESF